MVFSLKSFVIFIFSENTLFVQGDSKCNFLSEINDIRSAIEKLKNNSVSDYITLYFEAEGRYELILSKNESGVYLMERNDQYLDDKIMITNIGNFRSTISRS